MRNVVNGILYVLQTGCQWKAMPSEFGSGSAIHAYFQEWVEWGVFHELWQLALAEYDQLKGHRLAMAEFGRGDDQVAAGWGKKPGKTRPIAASWASSDRP
jgi:transposase